MLNQNIISSSYLDLCFPKQQQLSHNCSLQ